MPRIPKPYVHRGWFVNRAGGRQTRFCLASDARALANKRLREPLHH